MEQFQIHREMPGLHDSARPVNTIRMRASAVALAAVWGTCAWACSGVGPPGRPVVFGDQTNIIIWDEAHHMEHFIRNANFRSGADNFGFIAPTPGKPKLNEASTQAFYTLASLAPVYRRAAAMGGAGGGFGGGSRSSEVKVIQEADVAGFHATTLWSRSAGAINDWMNEHGYVSTPEVEKWAERYCGKGWYLTAFKVIDKTKLAASTGTVRMSFKTDKPFNPFYVPSSNIQKDRNGTLRVYFVSVGDYDAKIGGFEPWQTPQWTAPIPWPTADLLAKQVELPADAIPNRAQVETFVDNNFPRPADDDIYFVKKRLMLPPRAPAPTPFRSVPPLVACLGLVAVGLSRRHRV
ncbi:MAG TPA: DUF2330 domain-containing protein [Fimbriimonadaceae bacterium]|nr:DUF2330 domain-containing protein [Fimbriimonadaceae bacterium]